jgi:hypothetical protein
MASYSSFEEQYQTEQFFIDEGMLMPKFHKNYWMGLKTTEEDWPSYPRRGPCLRACGWAGWLVSRRQAAKQQPSADALGCSSAPAALQHQPLQSPSA